MPAAAPTASNADGGAAGVYALAVPRSLFQAGLPSRGRRGAPRATREVSPEAEFISVGSSSGRSRSVPGGARMVRKTVPAQAHRTVVVVVVVVVVAVVVVVVSN